jgi:hypothetical protein
MPDARRDRILTRIRRAAGGVDLPALLADRLSPSDLRSLLLEVHRRRAAALTAPDVLRRYEADRHAAPSAVDPRAIAALEAMPSRPRTASSRSTSPPSPRSARSRRSPACTRTPC